MPRHFPIIPVSLCVLLLAHWGLLWEVQPLATWFYPLAWWPYVVLTDRLAVRRGQPSIFAGGVVSLLGLGLASLTFWLIFEALNLRLANWYYVGVPENRLLRLFGISLSFATVLPLLLVTFRVVAAGTLFGPVRVRALAVTPGLLTGIQAFGVICLLLPLIAPAWFFPLVWGCMVFLLDPANHRAGRPSLLGDWEAGSLRRFVVLLTAGAMCGLLWECWNYWAVGKWIYTVPFFTGVKWFEMPPLGFLGFPVLAVSGFVFQSWLGGIWASAGTAARRMTIILSLLYCLITLGLLDRYTVDAAVPRLSGITVLTPEEIRVLKRAGMRSEKRLAGLTEAEIAAISDQTGASRQRLATAVRYMRLARHRGMGHKHATVLWRAGVRDITDLAAHTPASLAHLMGKDAPPTSRLSVWINAARRLSRSR